MLTPDKLIQQIEDLKDQKYEIRADTALKPYRDTARLIRQINAEIRRLKTRLRYVQYDKKIPAVPK
ncbi:MAG: hypothetical protein ACP5JG_13315 [Anaerolineae bacterium]